MISPSLITKTAYELGLRPLNSALFYGMTDGWPVLFGNYSITVVTENGGKFMKDSLKSADPMVKKVDCKDGRLTVFFRTKAKDLVSPIHAVLAELTRLGYVANPRCPICGEKDCDCAIFLGREFRFAHRACVDTLDSDADAETKKSQKQGSVLLGILGAFLGMLVGTLPNLFTILSMEMEYSLLFALIPICSYFGYKLLGGKMKRPIPLIVSIVMSVIGVIMLLFEAVTIISMKEYDIPAKEFFNCLGLLMAEPDVWSDLLSNCFREFLFTALGLFVAWRVISSTPAQNKQNAATTAKMSMVVLPGAETEAETAEETAVIPGNTEDN